MYGIGPLYASINRSDYLFGKWRMLMPKITKFPSSKGKVGFLKYYHVCVLIASLKHTRIGTCDLMKTQLSPNLLKISTVEKVYWIGPLSAGERGQYWSPLCRQNMDTGAGSAHMHYLISQVSESRIHFWALNSHNSADTWRILKISKPVAPQGSPLQLFFLGQSCQMKLWEAKLKKSELSTTGSFVPQ